MFILLTAIYVGFTVGMTFLVGQTVYEWTKRVSWMKNQDIIGFFAGFCAFSVLVKYGWPIYVAIVIKEFA